MKKDAECCREETLISGTEDTLAFLPSRHLFINNPPGSGFSTEAIVSRHEVGKISEFIPTKAAVKNPTPKIVYDEHNHERYPPGEPCKRAFACLVLTGGRFVYAFLIRLLIIKFILSMSVGKDVLGFPQG